MPFDPALVLHPDPTVRLPNSYEAILSYVQNRLSAADWAAFQGEMTSADLPLTATGILAFPNPSLYIDALFTLAMNFVSQPGRWVNINTLSGLPGVLGSVKVEGDGPVDATFNAIKTLVPHTAKLLLYQVHAVTEGTDAQATVSVRMEEEGRIATGQAADTDTVVASAKAYVNALNKLMVRRQRTAKAEIFEEAG